MRLSQRFARLILRLAGWRCIDIDRRPERGVLVGYPHTSNWDFPLGLLAIAPEGTRSLTPGWKSGFYRIALAADLPLLIGIIDYNRRCVGLVHCIRLSGDEAIDMAAIAACYEDCRGRRPENASPIRLL